MQTWALARTLEIAKLKPDFFFAAGVVPDREQWQYETILHFARAGYSNIV